jgi:AraC-like DNA-binding protein
LSLRWHWKLHAWNLKINNFSSRHQTRIDLAVSLLRKSDAPITNIALEVSYNNYPYFTSAFKKYYGCTPSQYRADSRKEKE